MTEFSIYQINTDRDNNRVCFLGLDSLERFQHSKAVDSALYDRVYMLCRKFGVDVKNFAIDRIPEELAGKSPKEIRAELSKTRSAMSEIGSRVSEEIYRRRADRSKDQER